MTKRIIFLLGLTSLILVLPSFATTHHLLCKSQTTSTDSAHPEAFEPPNRGHPSITYGSATR